MAKTIKDFIKKPGLLFVSLGHRGWWHWMDDETYLKIAFRSKMGKKLRLNPPVTFSEKLQWLKLHDRKPEYSKMVDKAEAKKYVSERIGEEYIIPTLGVWDRVEDIDFTALPDQFVLKATHDSGGLVICKDKSKLDVEAAKEKLKKSLAKSFYWGQREWPYKAVKPRIIAEKYIEDANGELNDYKFFCFGGKAKFFKIDFDRHIEHHANYYDGDGNLLPFGEVAYMPIPERKLDMPRQLKLMVELAEKLSAGMKFLRVDFYEVNGQVLFGELTFYPISGFGKYTDEAWDEKLGDMVDIS